MQNRGTGPIQTPEEAAEEARLRAEAERLKAELDQITDKVKNVSGKTRQALNDLLQEHQGRLAYMQEQLAALAPLFEQVESVPQSPLTEVMTDKLQASKDLYEAGIRLIELQIEECKVNLATSSTDLDPETLKPETLTFADITEAPEYLLAKAETDVAGSRLKLADLRLPMTVLNWYFDPVRAESDHELLAQVKDYLDAHPTLKVEMNQALSVFIECQDLVGEGKKIVKGIREYDWSLDMIHEFGAKVWGKLKGKLHQLDRLHEQVASHPPLAALFPAPEPTAPLPYKREHAWMTASVQTPGGTGRLNQTGKLGQSSKPQTGNLGGTGRLLNKQG